MLRIVVHTFPSGRPPPPVNNRLQSKGKAVCLCSTRSRLQ